MKRFEFKSLFGDWVAVYWDGILLCKGQTQTKKAIASCY